MPNEEQPVAPPVATVANADETLPALDPVAALKQAWQRFLRLGWIGVAHSQQGISPNRLSEAGNVAASIILGFCPLCFSKSLLLLVVG